MDIHDEFMERVIAAKSAHSAARAAAEQAAAEYRRCVRIAVESWKEEGVSQRQAADRIGITESALRELLRPEGTGRRSTRSSRAGLGISD